MKKKSTVLLLYIFIFWSCSSIKKLETTAPFTLGETYAQKWAIENEPEKTGYEVVIPLLSLDNDKAVLKNLYHKGKMTSLEIRLTELGTVAIAEFGPDSIEKELADVNPAATDKEPFPFALTETQAVISYVSNKKVKYYKINGIRRNLPISYPTADVKKGR